MSVSPDSPHLGFSRGCLTQRGQDRRQRFLALATERFLARGYDAVSVDELVRDIGGSKSNVYSYFGNKEGLFVDVIEGLCRAHLDDVLLVDTCANTLEEGLRRLIEAFARLVLEPRQIAFHRLIVAESVRFPSAGRTWYERGSLVSRAAFIRLLEDQHAKGNIRDGLDLAHVAAQLHGAIVYQLLTCPVILGQSPSANEVAAVTGTLLRLAHSALAAPAHRMPD